MTIRHCRQPACQIAHQFSFAILVVLLLCVFPMLAACTDKSDHATVITTATGTINTTGSAASASSAQSATGPTATTSDAGNSSSATAAGAIPKGVPSGILRLYCTPRTTLNPLSDRSASFVNISRLVYEGLFRIDNRGSIQPVLAKSQTISADGITIDITLAEGRVFHNGAPVTAQDVTASFNFMRNAGAASAYAGRQPDIASVSAVDAKTVRIILTKPQPDYAFQLVFPIVTAASLAQNTTKPLTILPGSGPYAITGYKAGTGLSLAVSERYSGWQLLSVQRITVKEYKDRHEAIRGFERDEIDLIDLPPADYPIYAIRNGLKLERFCSEQYVFLAFNNRPGTLLENAARLAFVKAVSRDQRLMAGSDELGIYPAAVPILPDSAIWAKTLSDDGQFASLYQSGGQIVMDPKLSYAAARKALVILAPDWDTLRVNLANRLAALLTERKIVSEVRIMPQDAYLAARQGGQYDILLAQVVVPDSMDPGWLLGQNPDAAVADSELLSRTGLQGYAAASAAVESRFKSGAIQVAAASDNAVLLRQAADLGPFAGIGFRFSALCSGNRVLGQVRPQMQDLYEGIEDLWIWST